MAHIDLTDGDLRALASLRGTHQEDVISTLARALQHARGRIAELRRTNERLRGALATTIEFCDEFADIDGYAAGDEVNKFRKLVSS